MEIEGRSLGVRNVGMLESANYFVFAGPYAPAFLQ
jgi:hypothetical protein